MPGAPIVSNAGTLEGATVTPVSSKSTTIEAVSDATATAVTAAQLLNHATITSTAVRWIKRGPHTTRVRIRGRVTVACTAVGTSPVVRVVGAILNGAAEPTADTPNISGASVTFRRLDNATETAAGVTLTFNATPTSSNSYGNGTYFYSIVIDAIDLEGVDYFAVLVETAAGITGGACSVEAIQMS